MLKLLAFRILGACYAVVQFASYFGLLFCFSVKFSWHFRGLFQFSKIKSGLDGCWFALHNVRMHYKSFLFGLVSVALCSFSVARAETLLGNFPTEPAGYDGEVSSVTLRGVTFTTSGTAFNVSSIALGLTDYISSVDTALMTIHLGTSSAPSGAVFASLTAPVSASNSYGEFVFTPVSAITLDANTLYWVVIAANSTSNVFNWARSNPSTPPTGSGGFVFGSQQISQDGGAVWDEGNNGPHSFAISGSAVPEPSTVLLLGFGLGFVGMVRRVHRV